MVAPEVVIDAFKDLKCATPRFVLLDHSTILLPECTDLTIVNSGDQSAQIVNRFGESFDLATAESISIGQRSTIDQLRIDATNTIVKLIYFM